MNWPHLVARICGNTGWMPHQVREHVDLPMLEAMQHEWAQHPPTHHLVAAYLGYQKPAKSDPSQPTEAALADVLPLMPVLNNAPPIDDTAWNNRSN